MPNQYIGIWTLARTHTVQKIADVREDHIRILGLHNYRLSPSYDPMEFIVPPVDQQPAFEFRAYRFTKYGDDPNGKIDFSATTSVSPQEIEQNCQALADVQRYTDKAAETVNARELKEGKRLSNREYGTAVHKDTKDQVDDLKLTGRNPYNLSAEATFLKGAPETYGTKDAVRVDVWEPRRDIKTICLYDPKTGDSPRTIISPARAAELAEHSFAKGYTRLYIIEVRPTVKRNPPFR